MRRLSSLERSYGHTRPSTNKRNRPVVQLCGRLSRQSKTVTFSVFNSRPVRMNVNDWVARSNFSRHHWRSESRYAHTSVGIP